MVSAAANSCRTGEAAREEEPPADVQTPVTVTTISHDPLADYIELNATSAFLQKSYVKANTNGYLTSVRTVLGKQVSSGQVLFTVQTKESQAIGNTIDILDSTIRFSGVNTIKAGSSGYVTELNHQGGEYVQDGEQLAVITNSNSFVFLLNLPYEYRPYVSLQKAVELVLPDGMRLHGVVASMMPSVDSAAQTQSIVIKVHPDHPIPENLIAKVQITKTYKQDVPSLPKAAILTDEAQTDFWVMKMIDSVTAVKVPVTKGLSGNDRVEIVQPRFAPSDRILLTGNYGLPDTAKVKIEKANP